MISYPFLILGRASRRLRASSHLLFIFSLAMAVTGVTLAPLPRVSGNSSGPGLNNVSTVAARQFAPASGDTCANATVINPASLPFTEESSTVGAGNDIDPGGAGCVPGAGPDVVYSFTPSATDTYTVGATPTGSPADTFDVSLYIITDCANPAGTCVAGSNAHGLGRTEVVTPTLNAGTRYFIVVDSPTVSGQGAFHFALRRGKPSNDTCASPAVLDPTRLPITTQGSTMGATDDVSSVACLSKVGTAVGPDVVYQFTSNDTQNYVITVTPVGNFDCSVYIVTDCATVSGGCKGSDINGAGEAETVTKTLNNGTTYFIFVDGFSGDSGDFTLAIVPTVPHVPAAPTNLTAHSVSSTEIDLAWQDNSSNESGFRIERSLDGANFGEIAQTQPNVTTFNDTGLTPQTTYFYRVFAFNNFGNSDPTNIAADTTPAPPVPQFPVLNVNPESIDFGTVQILQSADRTVTLSNSGGQDLIVSSIGDPAGAFSIVGKPALPLTIAPAASVDITVRFAPLSVGPLSSSFAIGSNDPQRPSVAVSLSGTGAGNPVADLVLTPPFFDFANGSGAIQAEIRNGGGADLLIGNIQLPSAPFSLSGVPALPVTLRPGESFTFTVNFNPTTPGVFSGSMNIINNDPDQIFMVVRMRGTSTPQSEQLKLRAPSIATAVVGVNNTLNVVAVNGTNTDIHLSATAIQGGVFNDRGNGRGDLALTPAGPGRSTAHVTFTATDSANRTKTLQSTITIVPAAERIQVQVSFTAPETAPGQPTGLGARDLSIVPLSTGVTADAAGFTPSVAAGIAGYAIYRSTSAGSAPSPASIVAIVPSSATSVVDSVAIPAGTSSLSSPMYYVATAIYGTSTESAASNEATTAPTMANLQFKKKQIRFQRANSNVEGGAVLLVDGHESFPLAASGDLIVVGKNAVSTPGNLKPRDLSAGTHSAQVRNPHGQVSAILNFTR